MLLSNIRRVIINATITQQGPVAHFVHDAMSNWVSDLELTSIGDGEDDLDFSRRELTFLLKDRASLVMGLFIDMMMMMIVNLKENGCRSYCGCTGLPFPTFE